MARRARWLTLLLFLVVPGVARAALHVAGTVVDPSGAPLSDVLVSAGPDAEVTTDTDGRFDLSIAADGPATITAVASDWQPTSVVVSAPTSSLRIVLQTPTLHQMVTVTASRGLERLPTPEATTVVRAADLLNAGAGALDDALRNTPGFSLFRRSSSRASNPTTQGVTLRGVSGSGASRTLVLVDGLPLNDPFGTWVYWNRVPQAAIDRVEVLRGGTGDLYGADAMGGVINVLTFDPSRTRARVDLGGGSHGTARGSGFGSAAARGWNLVSSAEWVGTNGVPIVAREARGPVDIASDSDYRTGFVGGGYARGVDSATIRVGHYHEDRGNGTPLQVNTTGWTQVSGAATAEGRGLWTGRVAAGRQSYYQTFTAVAADRRSERLTTAQTTPARFILSSGEWLCDCGSRISLLTGGEVKRTRATVDETRYAVNGVASGPFSAGGTDTTVAGFAHVRVPTARGTVLVGLRADHWRSTPTDPSLPTHEATFLSPRGSVSVALGTHASVHASAYRSARTPSLNELHRGFRAGNVVTNPNPLLDPETLVGAEGGVLTWRGIVSARVTVFWNSLDHAVTNATLASTPAQITRQRQNTDTVRARGVEAELDVRPGHGWTLGAVAAITDSTFRTTPAQPALQGNRLPQVPRLQIGGSVTYASAHGLTGSAQARVSASQFDDDINQFVLGRYGVIDGAVSQALGRWAQAYVTVENLLDAEYDVGRTPIRTVGWPRTLRVGVRLFVP
jgi:outer membrane receptor protein involved in Fe transport